MKCKKCHSKASVELRRHHMGLCSPHYVEFFASQISRNIKRFKMLNHEDNILIAVSGGKDSLALWNVLLKLGYSVSGLHINLGIGEYSSLSSQKCQEFAEKYQVELIEVDLAAEYGLGVPELSKSIGRAPCSGCGLNKRYLFNQVALDRGFDVVVTGHNLDDESATLLGNLLHWQESALSRQSPVLGRTTVKLVKKVKPLYTFTERETASYCLITGIDYVEQECPNATGAHSIIYKNALNQIEDNSPGSKQQFLKGFLDGLQPQLASTNTPKLNECTSCGQSTTNEICAFCRMWERAHRT